MRYDFTSHMERHGKDSIAVDGLGMGFAPEPPEEGFDVIPMWVADMNFPTVPTVTDAIIERAKHPAFGYFSPTDEYYDSIPLAGDPQRRHRPRARAHWLRERRAWRRGGHAQQLCCARRQGPSPQSDLHWLHQELGEQRALHRALAAQDRRGRRLADGLRGHGGQARPERHPRRRVLLAAQPVRARLGALGDRARHGAVPQVRLRGGIRRDLERPHPAGPQARAHAERLRRRPPPHGGPLRAEQDLQPGRPGWLLPRHIRQEPARPRHFSQLQVPL